MTNEKEHLLIRLEVISSGHPNKQTALTHIKYILDASKANANFWQELNMTRLEFKMMCQLKWDINIDNANALAKAANSWK